MPPVGDVFAASIHGQIGVSCTDCHADLQGKDLPHGEKLAPPSCVPCHEEAVAAYGNSVHAHARSNSRDSDAAWCSSCHGVHDIRSSKDPASPTYHFNVPATCGKCHGNAAIIAKAHIKAGDVMAHYQDSIHARALTNFGLSDAPTCASCHGPHQVLPASDPKSPVNRANISKTCGNCHEGILKVYETSVHGMAARGGNTRAAVCVDCHTAHGEESVHDKPKAMLTAECGTCHKEADRTFHGDSSTLAAATCANCHGSHGILPKRDPDSLVSEKRRAETCQACHAAGSVQVSPYDPHQAANRRPSRSFAKMAATTMPAALLGFAAVYLVFRRKSAGSRSKTRRRDDGGKQA